jgi:hypothetical protein
VSGPSIAEWDFAIERTRLRHEERREEITSQEETEIHVQVGRDERHETATKSLRVVVISK